MSQSFRTIYNLGINVVKLERNEQILKIYKVKGMDKAVLREGIVILVVGSDA